MRRDYQKDGDSQHRLGEFMIELVKGLSQNDVVTYPHAFLSGHMQILDLP